MTVRMAGAGIGLAVAGTLVFTSGPAYAATKISHDDAVAQLTGAEVRIATPAVSTSTSPPSATSASG